MFLDRVKTPELEGTSFGNSVATRKSSSHTAQMDSL